MFTRAHSRKTLIVAVAVAMSAAIAASGCSVPGGVKDRSVEVKKAWAAFPASAEWDLEIRGVVAQSKSTGSHDAPYTIYLTKYVSKQVPGFAVYQTIDVPNDDSMDLSDRVGAFFMSATDPGTAFGGMKDPTGFMKWFAENHKDKYFLRMTRIFGPGGKSSYSMLVADGEPTASTLVADPGTEIPLALDEKTGAFSTR